MEDNNQITPPSEPTPPNDESKDYGLCALIWVIGLVVGFFTGVGAVLAPLVMWLLKKDESAQIDQAGKAALNFNISYLIWAIINGILCLTVVLIPICLPILGIISLMWIIFSIIGAVKANDGELDYKPWLTISFLK